MKIEYHVTFYVYEEEYTQTSGGSYQWSGYEEYVTIASGFKKLEDAISFASKTDGQVEVVASYIYEDGRIENEGDYGEYVHVGFIDGVQQYHDEG